MIYTTDLVSVDEGGYITKSDVDKARAKRYGMAAAGTAAATAGTYASGALVRKLGGLVTKNNGTLNKMKLVTHVPTAVGAGVTAYLGKKAYDKYNDSKKLSHRIIPAGSKY